jgi:hypothetical protein
MRDTCGGCGGTGAEEHYDRYGIYVTRKHPECLTKTDKGILRWVHTPDDGENLDEDY